MRISSRRSSIEYQLPYFLSYMSVMAKAGSVPESIFKSISEQDPKEAIPQESKMLMRDVSVFGRDILSALDERSRKVPSHDFAEVLLGVASTIRMGGSLSEYLEAQARNSFARRRVALRKFMDMLAILGEFYVAIFVAAPLIFVVLLIVMSLLSGAIIGGAAAGPSEIFMGLDPIAVLQLIIYLYIPFMAAFLLTLIELLSPKV